MALLQQHPYNWMEFTFVKDGLLTGRQGEYEVEPPVTPVV